MSSNILTPIAENFATKFYFGKIINPYTFHRLFSEFRSDEYEVNKVQPSTEFFVKLINKKEKKTIELTKDYIAFFPILDDEKEIEDIRKRIFRHVAKRYEVYSSTSKENLELSTGALLKNDLRTCASLLYYSLHKYTSSLMYHYFNTTLNLSDHDIIFDEIEHYTSRMFLKFKDIYEGNGKIKMESTEDIQDLLHHHTSRPKVDPFMLLRYTMENEKNYSEKLVSYIGYLSNYLFSLNYYIDGSTEKYNMIYQELTTELESERNQEKEVKATIAFCLKESYKENNNCEVWLFYAVALRLYWLRQTADYEFDFDVKTSVKEMAILVYTIGSIIEINEVNNSDEERQDEEKPLENSIETDELSDSSEIDKKMIKKTISCPLYSVDITFPDDLLSEEENKNIGLFMSVLHLDSQFDKSKIIH
ncbi:hypothetical protein J1P26_22830, partial [Neobacillus sp. MM2021_6]